MFVECSLVALNLCGGLHRSRIAEDDGAGYGEDEQHGVEERGDNFKGGDCGETCRHEELCAVGDETLHDARAGVEDTGAASGVYTVALGNVSGNFSHAENGNRVVCRAEVR